jgi:hypothetical protein
MTTTKTKPTKSVPRLDATAFKTIKRTMKTNKKFSSIVQKTPLYNTLLQNVQKELKRATTKKISGKKPELDFIFSQFVQLNLLHAAMVLLSQEPDCLVVFLYPSRHMKVEIYTDKDDHNRRFYLVDEHKNGTIQKQFSFWDKNEFISYIIGILKEKLPKNIDVFRSSISTSSSPVSSFITLVGDTFGKTEVPKRLVRLYNE